MPTDPTTPLDPPAVPEGTPPTDDPPREVDGDTVTGDGTGVALPPIDAPSRVDPSSDLERERLRRRDA